MRTLIMLCAGASRKDGNFLLLDNFPGTKESLISKALLGIFPESYDRIIFSILSDKISGCKNLAEEIRLRLPDGISPEFYELNSKTNGPAETAYLTIKAMQVSGSITLRDADNYISVSEPLKGNSIAGLNLNHYDDSIEELRRRSFVTINEHNQVLDITEKKLSSEIISVGGYSFKNAQDFIYAYEKLNTPYYPISRIYVSHIISYLLGYKNSNFFMREVSDYLEWGTPMAWEKLKIKLEIGNLTPKKKLALFDMDGTLFDTTIPNCLSYNEAISPYGAEISEGYFRKYCTGKHFSEFIQKFVQDSNLYSSIHSRKKEIYSKYVNKAVPNKALFSIIDNIKSEYYVAIVTTASRKNTMDLLHEFKCDTSFDLIICGEDVKKRKPHPEGYLKAMKYFNMGPENTIIFEDSPEGIKAAEASGASVFIVKLA